jgi:hypothetical protein
MQRPVMVEPMQYSPHQQHENSGKKKKKRKRKRVIY